MDTGVGAGGGVITTGVELGVGAGVRRGFETGVGSGAARGVAIGGTGVGSAVALGPRPEGELLGPAGAPLGATVALGVAGPASRRATEPWAVSTSSKVHSPRHSA